MAMFDSKGFGNVAMMLGPMLMAKGMNMPGIASLGPAMIGNRRQREQQQQQAAMRERELALKEAEAARKAKFAESVGGMFGAPATATPPAGVPGAMIGGSGGAMVPPAAPSMFGDLTPEERRIAEVMATSDPMAALEFAAKRSAPPEAPDPTTAMREAEAMGYAPGTPAYTDYLRQRTLKPGVQVNVGPTGVDVGDPPKGMVWGRDADGKVAFEEDPATGFMRPVAVPIAGGPVEEERRATAEAEAARTAQRQKYADVVTQDIDRVLGMVEEGSFPITGPIGKVASYVPGTPAYDAAQLVETVRANVGFDRLQEMRAASPTGGAVGQVSNFENRLMQATLGSLEQAQTKEQFTRALKRVRDTYAEIVNPPISDLTDQQLLSISDPSRLSMEDLKKYVERIEAMANE